MSIPEMIKGNEYRVYWIDADNDSGWQDHDEEADNNAVELRSSGVFVSLGPKFLTLSFSWNEEADQWLGKHRIPRGMITRVTELFEGRDIII